MNATSQSYLNPRPSFTFHGIQLVVDVIVVSDRRVATVCVTVDIAHCLDVVRTVAALIRSTSWFEGSWMASSEEISPAVAGACNDSDHKTLHSVVDNVNLQFCNKDKETFEIAFTLNGCVITAHDSRFSGLDRSSLIERQCV